MNKLARAVLKALLYPLFRQYVKMPGRSFNGSPEHFSCAESNLRAALVDHVSALAGGIGVRHHKVGDSLPAAAGYIRDQFISFGFQPQLQQFDFQGCSMHNIAVVIPGKKWPSRWFVIGSHYDTVATTGGADDNASGVAAMLQLARLLKSSEPDCTICLVAYANEEHNGGAWENMGSYVHASSLKQQGVDVIGMISLEMLGYFSEAEGSQKYPFPFNIFYPSRGDFIAFVGNKASADFVRFCIKSFRASAAIPSEGAAPPDRFSDIARSDHWSFWQHGWPALMVTDTSNFRNPFLHTMQDTADTLDYDKMTRVVLGLENAVKQMTRAL